MESTLRTYLIGTHDLTSAERMKTEELISAVCVPWGISSSDTFVYVVHTHCTVDEFASIPFPAGCVIRDITGQNIMPLY